MNRYTCDADDFYVNMNLNTEMELPTNRDTVLHYFEQMKKAFPELRNFYTRESGDLVLEGDKEQEAYRWLAIEPQAALLGAGQSRDAGGRLPPARDGPGAGPAPADDQRARLRGARRDVRVRLHRTTATTTRSWPRRWGWARAWRGCSRCPGRG